MRTTTRSDTKYYVGLDKIALFGEDSHPTDLMESIDAAVSALNNLTIAVRKKNSKVAFYEMWEDLYEEWGQWSHNFNHLLRLRLRLLQDDDNEAIQDLHQRLSYVYAYWWNRHHWIQHVMMKYSKLAGGSKRKGIQRGRDTLQKCIKGELTKKLSAQFKAALAELCNKNYLMEFKGVEP